LWFYQEVSLESFNPRGVAGAHSPHREYVPVFFIFFPPVVWGELEARKGGLAFGSHEVRIFGVTEIRAWSLYFRDFESEDLGAVA
jgi:hypothetical protein